MVLRTFCAMKWMRSAPSGTWKSGTAVRENVQPLLAFWVDVARGRKGGWLACRDCNCSPLGDSCWPSCRGANVPTGRPPSDKRFSLAKNDRTLQCKLWNRSLKCAEGPAKLWRKMLFKSPCSWWLLQMIHETHLLCTDQPAKFKIDQNRRRSVPSKRFVVERRAKNDCRLKCFEGSAKWQTKSHDATNFSSADVVDSCSRFHETLYWTRIGRLISTKWAVPCHGNAPHFKHCP